MVQAKELWRQHWTKCIGEDCKSPVIGSDSEVYQGQVAWDLTSTLTWLNARWPTCSAGVPLTWEFSQFTCSSQNVGWSGFFWHKDVLFSEKDIKLYSPEGLHSAESSEDTAFPHCLSGYPWFTFNLSPMKPARKKADMQSCGQKNADVEEGLRSFTYK